ncbi:MAG: MCE family protein [Pseudonocardiaceae bacterium]|nr:MCE family protein [Pseudonocardiaceae bacterium]
MRRLAVRAATAALTVALTSGCAVFTGGLQEVPLPGGADVGDNPYQVTVVFDDVLELVEQSLVKVNGVDVGSVTEIRLDPGSWNALVTVTLNDNVELPANAQARVRSTSLLGEKFVELAVPEGQAPRGQLSGGDRIPLASTSRATEVEEVLGALSMLLNGGGVAQIRTIAAELNNALEGNEPQIRALLGDLDRLVSALDDSRGEITRALDSLNRLSGKLAGQRDQIATALENLGPGLEVLADQRTQLVTMLQALDRLSAVGVDTINRSREDTLADLRLLQPILTELAAAGENLPKSLELLATFPFTDDGALQGLKGDYANLFVRLDLNLGTAFTNLSNSGQPLQGVPGEVGRPLAPGGPLLGPLLDPLGEALPAPDNSSPPEEIPLPLPSSPPPSPRPDGGLLGPLGPLLGGGP